MILMKNNNDLVSIILPTYNGSKYIRQSIDSCLTQTYTNIEVIVVDDCSTDNTPSIIKSYVDTRLKYIRHNENKKLPLALNTGFASSTGQYLTWTSDDNYFAPTAIEELILFMATKKDVAFVYSDYYILNDLGETRVIEPRDPKNLLLGNCIGPCFLYKRSIYDSIGGFDNKYFLCEDYEYWVRAYLANFKFSKLNKRVYFYRQQSNSLTASATASKMQKTELKIIGKIFSTPKYKNNYFRKMDAMSNCYYRTAILHREANNDRSTMICAILAFVTFPLIIFNKKYFKFIISFFIVSRFRRHQSTKINKIGRSFC